MLVLLTQIHPTPDILTTWLEHYRTLGVGAFHLVVHGSEDQLALIEAARSRYPIEIRVRYGGPFSEVEKLRHLNRLLSEFRDQWVIVVDDDEFLELPFSSVGETTRWLGRFGATSLFAPMLQRLRADGSLESPEVLTEPFIEFPLCSVDLFRLMGSEANRRKYPLFRCGPGSQILGGNHQPPNGPDSASSPLVGVSHHFKWRKALLARLTRFIESRPVYHYWHESETYLRFLETHDFRVPLDDAFPYSRPDLFARGLLRGAGWRAVARRRARRWLTRLAWPRV